MARAYLRRRRPQTRSAASRLHCDRAERLKFKGNTTGPSRYNSHSTNGSPTRPTSTGNKPSSREENPPPALATRRLPFPINSSYGVGSIARISLWPSLVRDSDAAA